MRGPSSADCEKSYVRTGIVSAGMLARAGAVSARGNPCATPDLVKIAPAAARHTCA